MEITHPYLRMAAGALLAAGLASACSGGSSGTAATTPMPDPDPDPMMPPAATETREPAGCTVASDSCVITTVSGDTTTVRTITNMDGVRTDTTGTMRTITRFNSDGDPTSEATCTVADGACSGPEVLVRTYTYDSDGDLMTTSNYEMGRLMSRVSGGVTTNIEYSASMGGRTETTMKSTGTLVQQFSVYSGGTATSTVFTSTNGRTVTTALAGGMRQEIVYADDARMTRVTMRVGAPMENSDTGFAPGPLTRTTYDPSAVSRAGVSLPVEWEETVTLVAMGEAPDPVLISRTYVTERDMMGRETERETLAVANGINGARTRLVETVYPAADDAMMRTLVVTTSVYESGAVTRSTEVTTVASGAETTIVRNGPSDTGAIITTTTRNPASATDGSTTVTILYGAAHGTDDENRRGETDTIVTNSAGTEVVTTASTGTGDDRVVLSVVTADQRGVETRRVTFVTASTGTTRTTATTEYMRDGTSTVTTVTATRGTAEDAEYETTGTVVRTRDAARRETLRVTMDDEGMETGRYVTVWSGSGDDMARTETRTFSGGTNDRVMDIAIKEWDKDNALIRDAVLHPGVQSHAIVTDAQYAAIQGGMAMRTGAKTVMGRAHVHFNYSSDDAFAGMVTGLSGDADVEMEIITRSPACTASGCTYDQYLYAVEPYLVPEFRAYQSGTAVGSPDRSNYGRTTGVYWNAVGDGGVNHIGQRRFEPILFRLMSDLLRVGGAGVDAEYTAPGGDYTTAATAALGDSDTRPNAVVTRTAMDAMDRNTFTYLKDSGLPRGVLGIGQQVKEVDTYLRLGGTRAQDPDVPVRAEVENYFGWMANSMFTVRRVTAQGVTGTDYDWVPGAVPDPTDEVRVTVAMASGDPSTRLAQRSVAGMTDPGTWTGAMLGVGSVQGERYRGRAVVTVDFANNSASTKFDQIRLALDSAADLADNPIRFQHVSPELSDMDGITFTGGAIQNDGSYTSYNVTGATTERTDMMVPGTGSDHRTSSLSAQFYGDGAEEVAGTFNVFGVALGKTGSETEADLRGDLVGAFGAARDPLTETENVVFGGDDN